MEQRKIGVNGLHASELALGCLNFGSRTDQAASYRLLDEYCDAGGNFLDTANNYAFWNEGCIGGESELLLGQWMRERGNRAGIVLATKVGAKPTFPGGSFDHMEGLSRQAIEKAVDESLRRLGTDYIDLYYAHIDDENTALEETLEALNDLVLLGKVREIGCSNHRTSRLQAARSISRSNNWASYSCIQQRYTYLRPLPGADFGVQVSADDELLDYCKNEEDLTLLAYSPLLNGAYTRPDVDIPSNYVGSDMQERLLTLSEVAQETEATRNQVVLAWLRQRDPKAIALIAASDSRQLGENLASVGIQLSPTQLSRLDGAF